MQKRQGDSRSDAVSNGAAEPKFQPITMRVEDFSRWSGIGTRQVYRMIEKGELKSVKFGRLRLINVEEYRKMVSE